MTLLPYREFLNFVVESAEYRCSGLVVAIKCGLAPSCLDEHVGGERFFDGVDLSEFDEDDLNVD